METIITAPPKSVQAADIIRREIVSGNLKRGVRLCSTRDMAKKYAITKQIAQSAFNILKKEGLIESHVGRGTFVASNAKSLATKTVMLMLRGIEDKHERMPILLPSVLQKHGYITQVFDVAHSHEKSNLANIKALLGERPRAFVATTYAGFNFNILKWVDPATQLLLIKHFEGNRDYDASYILEDYVEGGRRACEYLLEKGRRRIATVSYERHPGWTSDHLLAGVERILADKGLKVFKYLDGTGDDASFIEAFGKGGCPDGVFCLADFYYGKVRKATVRHGLVPERDFDAIGYGNTPWAETFGIASMDSTSEKIAEKVAEALDKRENVKMKIVPELMTHYREH